MISVEATEVIRPPLIHSMGQLFGHRLSHDVGRTEAQQFRDELPALDTLPLPWRNVECGARSARTK